MSGAASPRIDVSDAAERPPEAAERLSAPVTLIRQERAESLMFAPPVTLAWLVRLRWGAVLAQAVTVLVAAIALGGRLQTPALALIVGATAASNVVLQVWLRAERRVRNRLIGALLIADAALLTALLYFSGGASNPFSVLYLVYVTLGALALGIRWASALVGIAATGYALLFFEHVTVAGMDHEHHHDASAFSIHLQAMWVAFTVTAALIAFFVARMQRALRERDEQLAEAQRAAARSEKLASLTTLAAGAAHELGTPLATIAVTSKELERALTSRADLARLTEDARLIREEVERCGRIVQQMSGRSGEAMGEALEAVAMDDFVRELRQRAGEPERLAVEVESDVPSRVVVPVRGLIQALGNLVTNALEASAQSEDTRVVLRVHHAAECLHFDVEDRGVGISEHDLARAGEPFFSTKLPGKGMGLGLFLANAFAAKWRGRLAIESEQGRGTRVRLELPVRRIEPSHGH
jgi:two-component system sensor histidine kinase RegB